MMAAAETVSVVLLLTLTAPVLGHIASCQDHTINCTEWATLGYCLEYKEFMVMNCPSSCNSCLDPDCFDRDDECINLFSMGLCSSHYDYMKVRCPHSCNLCDPAALHKLVTRPSITNPNFECGRWVPSSSSSLSTSPRRGRRQIVFPDSPQFRTRVTSAPRVIQFATQKPNQHIAPQTSGRGSLQVVPGKVDIAAPLTTSGISVDDTFCGATPITDHYLITAAHCVIYQNPAVQTVRLGELDFSSHNERNSRPVDYEVARVVVHPGYKQNTLERYNDVALIETKTPIAFNEYVYPYCITRNKPTPKTLVTGAGFGLVNATHRSSKLQEAELEVVDSKMCEDIYKRHNHEQNLRQTYPELLQGRDVLCAANSERDACRGDSGGPLYLEINGRRHLVGIVGSGTSCMGSSASVLPGLYVSVADHITFIDSTIYG